MDLPKGRADYDQNKDYYLELLEAEQTILELKKEINNLKDGYKDGHTAVYSSTGLQSGYAMQLDPAFADFRRAVAQGR